MQCDSSHTPDDVSPATVDLESPLKDINDYYCYCLEINSEEEKEAENIFLESVGKTDAEKQQNAEKIKQLLILLVSDPSHHRRRLNAFVAIINLLKEGHIFFHNGVWNYFADLRSILADLSPSLSSGEADEIKKIIDQAENSAINQWFQTHSSLHRHRYFIQNSLDVQYQVVPDTGPSEKYYNEEPSSYYNQTDWLRSTVSMGVVATYMARRTSDYLVEEKHKSVVFVSDAEARKKNDARWSIINLYNIIAHLMSSIAYIGPAVALLSSAITAAGYHLDRRDEDRVDQQIIQKHRAVKKNLEKKIEHIVQILPPEIRNLMGEFNTRPTVAEVNQAIAEGKIPLENQENIKDLAYLLATYQRLLDYALPELNENHTFDAEHRKHLFYSKITMTSSSLLMAMGGWIGSGNVSASIASSIFAVLAGPIGLIGALAVIAVRVRKRYKERAVILKEKNQALKKLDDQITDLDHQIKEMHKTQMVKKATEDKENNAKAESSEGNPKDQSQPIDSLEELKKQRSELVTKRTDLQTHHIQRYEKQFRQRLFGETMNSLTITSVGSLAMAVLSSIVTGAIAGGTGWALIGGVFVATCCNPIGWTLIGLAAIGLIGYAGYKSYQYQQSLAAPQPVVDATKPKAAPPIISQADPQAAGKKDEVVRDRVTQALVCSGHTFSTVEPVRSRASSCSL